jgi:hypothetical protein
VCTRMLAPTGLANVNRRERRTLAERTRDLRISPGVPSSQRAMMPRPGLDAVEAEVRRTFKAGAD